MESDCECHFTRCARDGSKLSPFLSFSGGMRLSGGMWRYQVCAASSVILIFKWEICFAMICFGQVEKLPEYGSGGRRRATSMAPFDSASRETSKNILPGPRRHLHTPQNTDPSKSKMAFRGGGSEAKVRRLTFIYPDLCKCTPNYHSFASGSRCRGTT